MNEDYFYQRPHHNLFNKFFYSKFMKTYNPLHEWRSYHPLNHVRLANWYGEPPHATWVDGSIDYTYQKYNNVRSGHFHQHENRKNKPFKKKNGGDMVRGSTPRQPTYVYSYFPKGCQREIYNYRKCISDKKNQEQCFDQKINIMEICPKWALESLRENKRFLMRATLIDNQTYRRAMKVSEYNKGRSLKDIKADPAQETKKIRGEAWWADDRYHPATYPSPDHNTNYNLGEGIIYNDVLGGNRAQVTYERRDKFAKQSYDTLKRQVDEGEISLGDKK
jgi:hypothetical protein